MTVVAIVFSEDEMLDLSGWGGYAHFANEINELHRSGYSDKKIIQLIKNGKELEEKIVKRKKYFFIAIFNRILKAKKELLLQLYRYKCSKILTNFDPQKPTIIWHQLNNYQLPGQKFFKISKIANIIMITTCHDIQDKIFPENFPTTILEERMENYKINLSLARIVFASTDVGKRELMENFGFHPDKISVIPHGIDVDSFLKTDVNKSIFNSRRQKLLIYPAKSWANKNHIEFIDAILLLPECNFKVILTGDLSSIEQNLARFRNHPNYYKRVIELGFINKKSFLSILKDSDGLIFPSSYEGFGYPFLEAAILRKPIFAFELPVLTEILGFQSTCVSVGEYGELFRKIENYSWRYDRGLDLNFSRALEYSWSVTRKSYEKAYLKILEE